MTFMYLKYCDLICFKYLQLVAHHKQQQNIIRENFRKQHNNISYTASAT